MKFWDPAGPGTPPKRGLVVPRGGVKISRKIDFFFLAKNDRGCLFSHVMKYFDPAGPGSPRKRGLGVPQNGGSKSAENRFFFLPKMTVDVCSIMS